MKTASIFTITLLVAWMAIAVLDLLLDIVPWAISIKVSINLGLLAVLALGVAIAKREYIEEKQMKKDKYID
ncbi:MAG: hypothetical protein ACI9WC_003097 [Arenicella sp.]|jgi:membrane protein implicated in regulation of membrane protease activity